MLAAGVLILSFSYYAVHSGSRVYMYAMVMGFIFILVFSKFPLSKVFTLLGKVQNMVLRYTQKNYIKGLIMKGLIMYKVFISLVFAISLLSCSNNVDSCETFTITENGNILFYNNPPALMISNEYYFAYITNRGFVKLAKLSQNGIVEEFGIHNYEDTINYNYGGQDDHAAPAILYDSKKNAIVIATSYHGTDLFLYTFSLEKKQIMWNKRISGRYTYPQLFYDQGRIFLFIREQKTGKSGDLVYFTSDDLYNRKLDILVSGEGYVIYNGGLVLDYPYVYTHYSKHSYEEGRLIGWEVVKYDLDSHNVIDKCDLGCFLDEAYFSNRPTGIGLYEGKVYLGTAWFNRPGTYIDAQRDNFSLKNFLLVLSGSMNSRKFRIEHLGSSLMPYYDTSISVFRNKFLYIQDGSRVISNIV